MRQAAQEIRKLKESLRALIQMASENDNALNIEIEVRET